MQFISTVNQALAILTIGGQIILVVFIAFVLMKQGRWLSAFVKNALAFSFIAAALATLGSLFYSEIAGYEPCKLCWFQRIFMYPQVIVLGLAWLKKDYGVVLYSLALSIIGALLAGYHYLLQIGLVPSGNCSAVGYSVSCSKRFVMQFGYITIPMMALTVFSLIVVSMIILKRSNLLIKLK